MRTQRVETTDAAAIVVDLTGIEFMDCSGVRVLLDAHRRSRDDGNRTRLVPRGGQATG